MISRSKIVQLKYAVGAVVVSLALVGCNTAQDKSAGGNTQRPVLAELGNVYSLIPAREGTASLRRAAASLGYKAGPDVNLEALGMIMVEYDLPSGVSGLEAIKALEAAVPSSTVGVNHAYRLQNASQTVSDRRQYANQTMNWPKGGCRAKRAVGIIDGGVNASSPGVAGARIVNQSFGKGSAASRRHGTQVASVLADPSRLRSVTVYSANVVSADPEGGDAAGAANIVRALDWMAANRVRVVNLSLAGPKNKLLKLAVDRAAANGMTLIAAAGNQGPSAPPQYPAAFQTVVAVTAVDARNRAFHKAVRGSHIEFAAPGVDIYVPSAGGGRYVSGTSLAAPMVVARMAAQAEANRRTLRADAIDLGAGGKDKIFGYGLVQAKSACAGARQS